MFISVYPLVNEQFAMEHGPLIVDLTTKIVIFHSYQDADFPYDDNLLN